MLEARNSMEPEGRMERTQLTREQAVLKAVEMLTRDDPDAAFGDSIGHLCARLGCRMTFRETYATLAELERQGRVRRHECGKPETGRRVCFTLGGQDNDGMGNPCTD